MQEDFEKITQEYKKIRELILSWQAGWDIPFEDIDRWFNNPSNLKNFLETNGLENSRKNKKIVLDICQDLWVNESYTEGELFENLKILADLYQISLSHIDILNPNTRHFKLTILDEVQKVILLTWKDIKQIEDKIWDYMIEELSSKSLKVDLNPQSCAMDIVSGRGDRDPILDFLKIKELKKLIYKNIIKNRKNILKWVLFFDKDKNNLSFSSPKELKSGIIWKEL